MKNTSRKDYFTGKFVTIPAKNSDNGKETEYLIGNVSGWNGNGVPTYDLLDKDTKVKVGELGNDFIKKYRKNGKV
jgi:hypothetical protein